MNTELIMATVHIPSYNLLLLILRRVCERNHGFDGSLCGVVSAWLCIFPNSTMFCVRAISSCPWRLPPLQYFLSLNKIIVEHNHCNSSFPFFAIVCYSVHIKCRRKSWWSWCVMVDSFFSSFSCQILSCPSPREDLTKFCLSFDSALRSYSALWKHSRSDLAQLLNVTE